LILLSDRKVELKNHRSDLRLIHCPAFRVKPLAIRAVKARYDFLLITSKNTFLTADRLPRVPSVVVIGERTATACPAALRPKVVLRDSRTEGVVKFFKSQSVRGKSLFFPRSKRGHSDLPRQLRRLGLRVTVRHSYTIEEESRFKRQIKKVAQGEGLKVFLLSSPSSFVFLKRRLGLSFLKRGDVRLVAIGTTTQRVVRSVGIRCFLSSKPDLSSLVAAGSRLH